MSSTINISEIIRIRDALDKANVPEEGRSLHYVDLNGESIFLRHDSVVTEAMIEAMPTWIRALFIGEVLHGK